MFDTYNFYSVCCIKEKDNVKELTSNESCLRFQKVVLNGNKSFLYLDVNKIDFSNYQICEYILDCDYIEFKSKNFEYVKKVLDTFGAKVVLQENVNGAKVEYYSVSFLNKHKMLGIVKVNLQVVWQNDFCTIGYPMVYTAY